ncbi:MAG TPA: ATP-binding cassette domain-containing protein [Gammaproteobacteria bacterium]|nr:ATP-binding cassette domain-containing protein [Gammaproteobacteria bacterium]
MLSFNNVAIRRGARLLLEKVTFTVFDGDKVGVIGANGSGKSSLFAVLTRKLDVEAGTVDLPVRLSLAHLAQEIPVAGRTAIDYVIDGDAELRALERELETAREGKRIATLHARMEAISGYGARARAGRLVHGLGFTPSDENKLVSTFSGGWRMRLNLARTLMRRSDLLLLDEPTNHLDLDALLWLEHWLKKYSGTLLLVSHDRVFLDAVTDRTLSLEQGTARLYPGNYSAFEQQRAERLAAQQGLIEKQQRRIVHMRRFVDRFRYKATKARQAQSRLKALARMERIAPAHVDSPFEFSFGEPHSLPRPLLRLEEVSAGYSRQPVLEGISITISPGDRIGLLGKNGSGKSTFIRLLAAEVEPLAGRREASSTLVCGNFAQHQLEQLDVEASPLIHLRRLDSDAGEQQIRDYLGAFGFYGDKALEPVSGLSGGEKARLVLAMLVHQRPNLLLLDEPTNHMDLEMRHALTIALQGFPGAIVLVSHDRYLIDAVSDDLWLAQAGRVERYQDDLAAYLCSLKDGRDPGNGDDRRAAGKPGSGDRRKQRRREEALSRRRIKPLKDALRALEAEIASLNVERAELIHKLADTAFYRHDADKTHLESLMIRQGEIERAIGEAEEKWLEVTAALEAAE